MKEKINFKSISSRLTNSEMKRVYAGSGSGDEGVSGYSCRLKCNQGDSKTYSWVAKCPQNYDEFREVCGDKFVQNNASCVGGTACHN